MYESVRTWWGASGQAIISVSVSLAAMAALCALTAAQHAEYVARIASAW